MNTTSPLSSSFLSLGAWLKHLRSQQDLTQEALAERVACSVQTIRFFESAKRRPSAEMAERLADVLQISAEERSHFIRLARVPLGSGPAETPVETEQAAPEPVPAAPVARIPIPATELIGRQAEFKALAWLLTEQGCRLVTLAGPGGMGKTRLALHAAHELAGHFAGGAAFVSLVAITSAAELPSAIANGLDVPLPNEGSPSARLDILLSGRTLLLVLDNFEHLIQDDEDVVALVAHIVQHIPSVRLLVTSRERLRVAGERVFELGGLTIPHASGGSNHDGSNQDGTRQDGTDSDAVLLFLQRARQASPSFALTPANRGALVRLCALLEGMPLGIELAAAWVRVLTPDEIVAEMARSIDFLALADRNAPPRHRSMRAVFEHSWKLLTPEERGVVARFAVFRDGFDREAARAVAGAGLAQLASLVDKSLVRTSTETGQEDAVEGSGHLRYTIHELLRQFLTLQLQSCGEEQITARRHAEYFTALAERVEPQLYANKTPALLHQLESELGNLRTALEWSIDQGHAPQLGLRLAGALGRYWYSTGAWREGHDWLHKAVTQQTIDHEGTDYALALTKLGELHYSLGDYTTVEQSFEKAMVIWRNHHDRWHEAWTLFQMGILVSTLGEQEQSVVVLEEALAIYRELDDPWAVATLLIQLAGVLMLSNHYARAGRLLDEALPILRRQKNESSVGVALNHLGWTHLAQGDYEMANACFHEASILAKRHGNAPLVGWSLRCLGISHYREEKFEEGAAYLRSCLQIYRQIGYTSGALIALEALAAVHAEQGRAKDAVRWLAVADRLRTTTGQPRVNMEEDLFIRRATEAAQTRLDEIAWQAAWRAGAELTLDEAYTLVLAG